MQVIERGADSQTIVQLCPHDSAPFDAICASYSQAIAALGLRARTVYLGKPTGAALPDAEYLRLEDLTATGALAQGLRALGLDAAGLVLCHRYRAYWGAVKAQLPQERCVAIAHEFGFFDHNKNAIYFVQDA